MAGQQQWLGDIALSHFRSHKLLNQPLDGRPVAIFGPNGAGKTNILEAVSLLSPGRGLRRATADDLSRKPEALGWKVSATLNSPHRTHEIAMRAEAGASRVVTIDEKTAPQVALGRIAQILWLVPAMDRLWIEGAGERRRFLDRITLSFQPNHAEAVLSYDKAMRERNRLLKDHVRDAHWYLALEGQMAKSGAEIHRNRIDALSLLAEAQSSAKTAFPAADLTLIEGEENIGFDEASLREVLANNRPNDLRAGRTLVGPHRSDVAALFAAKGIDARQCSTGEQKALLISLILSNARALATLNDAPPIILLDEVAAHLDDNRRAALYDEITAIGAQAFMTGTGVELFAEMKGRAQALYVSETGGLSETREVDL
ncbi:MAG: DNA replication/repair protein RecF [Paracoccaceae bacterium]|nr:DNA replication/repair protein RecF [Paracoccaceae bacterium]